MLSAFSSQGIEMLKRHITILAGIIALLFVTVLWQFAETQISLLLGISHTRIYDQSIHQAAAFDDDGIPMQIDSNGDKQYNPLFIARAAQTANLQRRLSGDSEEFVRLSDWLLDQLSETDSTCFAQYQYDVPKYGQEAPWSSALTQAVVMNVFAARAAMERDLDIYAKARGCLYSLKPGASELAFAQSDSSYWYMEYPADKPRYVLGSMLSILNQLYDYYELTRDPEARTLYERGFNALIEQLPKFDYRGYSYYDLQGTKADRYHHQMHIKLLSKMLELQDHPQILYYRNRWQKADSYPVLWQMVLNPQPPRILAFVLGFLALWALIYLILAATQRKEPDDPEYS
jgi:hypothetical protein